MTQPVKSGKEILDDFFQEIKKNDKINEKLANTLADLYAQGKFTDSSVKNALNILRTQHGNKN